MASIGESQHPQGPSARQRTSRRLLLLGVVLILLGLLLGLAVPLLANPRMGLASHLEGVMNGLLLIAVGFLWPKLSLSELLLKTTYWLVLLGSYANVVATFFAAAWGTSRMTPIAGRGHTGAPGHELLVSVLLVSLSVCLLAACLLLAIGLRGKRSDNEA